MPSDQIAELQASLRAFASARDWEQFHTPKNLAMALAGETGELVEIFQWLTPDDASAVMSSARADDVADELADVAIYLLRLADVLGVDLADAIRTKIDRNEVRFPVDEASGRADLTPRDA